MYYPKLLFKFTCLVPRGHPLIMAWGTEQNSGGPAWPHPMPEAPLHAGPLWLCTCTRHPVTNDLSFVENSAAGKGKRLQHPLTAITDRRESSPPPTPTPALEDLVKVPGALTNNGKHVSGRNIQYQGLCQGEIKQMSRRKP